MPALFIPLAAWLGTMTAVGLTIGTIIQIGLVVGMAIYGSAQARRQERDARDAYNASLQDRMATVVSADSPYVYVYGRAKVGASIVAMFSSGDHDQYKHLVCIHAAHECDAIEEVYIAGKALGTLDIDGNVISGDYATTNTYSITEAMTGPTLTLAYAPVGPVRVFTSYGEDIGGDGGATATQTELAATTSAGVVTAPDVPPSGAFCTYQYGSVNSHVRVKKHLGTSTDPADASLIAEVPSKWSTACLLRGFCYTVVRLDLNQAEFQGGIPSIQVLLRGKKLLDPRSGLTAWSRNPALVIYDYLRSELCGVDAADIPTAQVIAAANACAIPEIFTFNGSVTSDQPQAGVLEKMAQSMGGGIVSTTWDMFAGVFVAPVMALVQEDIVGSSAVTPGVSDASLFNGVKGQFISAENDYVATDIMPYQNPTYVAADGRELWTNIDFPYTDETWRVQNLCRIFLEDQRNGYTVKAEFSLKAWSLKIGQRVTLTSAFFGWSAKVFRVTDKSYSPTSMVELTLKEDDWTIWDMADAVVIDATQNTNLPNPFAVAPLSALTCISGTDALLMLADGSIVSRIRLTWAQATTQAVQTNGLIEVEWQQVGSDIWEKISGSGDSTSVYISPVQDGSWYTVRARAVNPYMNVKSAWSYAALHQVVGKTEPPANVTSFLYARQPDGTRQFSWGWDIDKPLDLAGYRIRYKQAASAVWEDMTSLHADAGFLVSSPYETNQLLAGLYTFAIKTVDTSNNEALDALYITATLENPRLGKILVAESDYSMGWTGTKTNATVASGYLEANDSSTWDTIPGTWDAWTRWAWTPVSPIVYDHPQIDIGAIITFKPLIQADADGTAVITESHSDDGATWTSYAALAGTITARYLRVRLTVTGAYPLVRELLVWLEANTLIEDINDLATLSAPGRIGVGDIRLPLRNTYSVIAQVNLALQNTGPGWSWEIIDKSIAGPHIKIYNSSNALADATIDAYVKGY